MSFRRKKRDSIYDHDFFPMPVHEVEMIDPEEVTDRDLRMLELQIRQKELELEEKKLEYKMTKDQKTKSLPKDIKLGRKSSRRKSETLRADSFAKLYQNLDRDLISEANEKDLEKVYSAVSTSPDLIDNKEALNAMLQGLILRRSKK